jgi:amidophosphoribosyltransferase
VESLGYLSLDGMKRAAGGNTAEFCHACFSGQYPTAIPEDTKQARNAAPLQVTMAV